MINGMAWFIKIKWHMLNSDRNQSLAWFKVEKKTKVKKILKTHLSKYLNVKILKEKFFNWICRIF